VLEIFSRLDSEIFQEKMAKRNGGKIFKLILAIFSPFFTAHKIKNLY